MTNIKTHKKYDEPRGCLLPISFSELDFEPKRIFIVNNVPKNTIRGKHAHYETRQFLICTSGKVEVKLDYNHHIETYLLEKGMSIVIPKLVWDTHEFLTSDTEIVVLSSTDYDENDYIRDYEYFKMTTSNY
jgi:dTDP-4-dehydrorhamnose 3,5-epimerase-like enzyme